MRILLDIEREEMLALMVPGERIFSDVVPDNLEAQRRIERYDVEPDGTYRMRLTEFGHAALRLPRVT